jgi:hypothetical protein
MTALIFRRHSEFDESFNRENSAAAQLEFLGLYRPPKFRCIA